MPIPKLGWRNVALFAALALLPACSLNMGTMTALATHNVSLPTQPLGREVEGSDCVYFLFGVPISGSLFPSLQEAVDNALAHQEGDALQNVAIYLDRAPRAYCLRVKGEVVELASDNGTNLSEKGVTR